MRKQSVCVILLLLMCVESFAQSKNNIQVESDVSLKHLTGRLNTHIANQRMPVVTMHDSLFTFFSYPSKQIGYYKINCAEIYFDVNEFGVTFLMSLHVYENPFVQVMAQSDGRYVLIRLRRLCAEM